MFNAVKKHVACLWGNVKELFEMTSLCMNWGIESLSTLVNCFVYYTHQPLLWISHVLWWRVVVLHHS